LITDSNILKQYIIKFYPTLNVKFIINNISHTANNINNDDDDSLLNTLSDFYIMSYSKCINSFSVYKHGSGFSQWCALTYGIPYSCKLLI